MNNLISHYPNTLSHEQCKIVIDSFERSPHKKKGEVGLGKHTRVKNSTDIGVYGQKDDLILNQVYPKFLHYKENAHPFLKILQCVDIDAGYNLQRYKDDEGYFLWHCEHSPTEQRRVLAWMVYLNDAQCGTEWMHPYYLSEHKEGSLFIWPALWTHAHRGVTPNIGLKYIATGWCSYYVS